ncbi:MAG: 4Fe-4S dicluster domain-containing protein [Candidatus Bathyarchaeia archaeon]
MHSREHSYSLGVQTGKLASRIVRRRFLRILAESLFILGSLRFASTLTWSSEGPIRPPGAVEEEHFNLLCVRCGICLQVCPTKTIMLSGLEYGVQAVNTPIINPVYGPCEFYRGRCEEEMRCGRYCPTGALRQMDRQQVKLGRVFFNSEYCLAYLGVECMVCAEMCPVPGAITIHDRKPLFNVDYCVGCGTCLHVCPANPKPLHLTSKGARRIKWLG